MSAEYRHRVYSVMAKDAGGKKVYEAMLHVPTDEAENTANKLVCCSSFSPFISMSLVNKFGIRDSSVFLHVYINTRRRGEDCVALKAWSSDSGRPICACKLPSRPGIEGGGSLQQLNDNEYEMSAKLIRTEPCSCELEASQTFPIKSEKVL